MTITITLEGLLLTLLAVAGIVLLIFLTVLVNNLNKTVKNANRVLEDAKVVSAVTADKAKKVDGLIDSACVCLAYVALALNVIKRFIAGWTNVVNAATNLAGMAKNAGKKKEKNKDPEE